MTSSTADGEILADVVVHAPRAARAELARAAVAAKVDVEDVVPGRGEGVREAPRREVPGVAVLAEAVDEEDRRARPSQLGRTFPDHCQRNFAAGHDELLEEGGAVLPVDRLLDGPPVEDHAVSKKCSIARARGRREFAATDRRRDSEGISDENSRSGPTRRARHFFCLGASRRERDDRRHLARRRPTDDTQTPAPKKPKKPKKKPKPAPAEDTTDTAAPAPDTAPAPTPAPAPEPAPPPPAATAAPPSEPPSPGSDDSPNTDVYEKPTKTYYFVGLRYRGNVIPQFMLNLFVNDGTTIYSNTVAAEIEIRRDGFSIIPWVGYTSYSTGDMLFLQKNTPDDPENYSDVQSSLGGLYVGVDHLWSKEIAKHVEFEYGAGVGIGYIFGTLTNDWVYIDPNNPGPLVGGNGNHYTPCPAGSQNAPTPTQFPSCTVGGHSNATTAKVGGYSEPNWVNGGSVPVVFPYIALPLLGLRVKPIKQLEMRIQTGFSLTGFIFGLSADYGIPPKKDPPPVH